MSDDVTDESEDYSGLDSVADDMMSAFHKKDRSALKSALNAFRDLIQSEDAIQDESI